MSGFHRLAQSCARLESCLAGARLGAAGCGGAGEGGACELAAAAHAQLLRTINTKAVLVTASVQRDTTPAPSLTVQQRKSSLLARLGGGEALRAQARAAALHACHRYGRPTQHLEVNELLQKMSDTQGVLDQLERQQEQREEELRVARQTWLDAQVQYHGVQQQPRQPQPDTDTDSRIRELIAKMEALKVLVNCLMSASMGYDWALDPGGLRRLLPSVRRAPFTPDSFLA